MKTYGKIFDDFNKLCSWNFFLLVLFLFSFLGRRNLVILNQTLAQLVEASCKASTQYSITFLLFSHLFLPPSSLGIVQLLGGARTVPPVGGVNILGSRKQGHGSQTHYFSGLLLQTGCLSVLLVARSDSHQCTQGASIDRSTTART